MSRTHLLERCMIGMPSAFEVQLPDGSGIKFHGIISNVNTQQFETLVRVQPTGAIDMREGTDDPDDALEDDLEGLKEALEDEDTPESIKGEIDHDIKVLEGQLGALPRHGYGTTVTCDGVPYEILDIQMPILSRQMIDITTYGGQPQFVAGVMRVGEFTLKLRNA